jgi:hypothetical protein
LGLRSKEICLVFSDTVFSVIGAIIQRHL